MPLGISVQGLLNDDAFHLDYSTLSFIASTKAAAR